MISVVKVISLMFKNSNLRLRSFLICCNDSVNNLSLRARALESGILILSSLFIFEINRNVLINKRLESIFFIGGTILSQIIC